MVCSAVIDCLLVIVAVSRYQVSHVQHALYMPTVWYGIQMKPAVLVCSDGLRVRRLLSFVSDNYYCSRKHEATVKCDIKFALTTRIVEKTWSLSCLYSLLIRYVQDFFKSTYCVLSILYMLVQWDRKNVSCLQHIMAETTVHVGDQMSCMWCRGFTNTFMSHFGYSSTIQYHCLTFRVKE